MRFEKTEPALSDGRRHDVIAVALLLLLPTLFFADVLAGQASLFKRDLASFHYPSKKIFREIVRGGEFPFWNRAFNAGQPLAANPQHQVFYPPTWLLLLPSYDLGFRLHILLHIYIALFGMYVFLRSLRCGARASFLGALSFGMGGLFLSYVNLLPFLFCAAWLPLTCMYTRKFLLQPQRRTFALASLFLGVQMLVAEPTTVIQTGMLMGMYALYRGWRGTMNDEQAPKAERSSFIVHRSSLGKRVATMARNLGSVAALSLLAACIAAIQLLPAIGLARDSVRSRALNFDLVAAWSMPLAKLAELVYPNILGHTSLNGIGWYWGGELYPGIGGPFILSIYCGLTIAAFLAAGLVCRMRGWQFVVVVSGISVAVALGAYTPLLRTLYDAGIFQTLRYPEKFVLTAVFVSIVFASKALDRALAGDQQIRDAAAGFALATAVIAGTIALLGFMPGSVDAFIRGFGLRAGPSAITMVGIAWSDWPWAVARSVVLFLIILTMFSRRAIWTVAALLFALADLGPVVSEVVPRITPSFFREAPLIESRLPGNRRDFRIFHDAEWRGGDRAAQRYFSSSSASQWTLRNGLFPMIATQYGFQQVLERDFDRTALLNTTELLGAVNALRRSGGAGWEPAVMAMSNAWYRTEYRDFEREMQRTGGDVTRMVPVRFVEAAHSPRYYFARELIPFRDRDDFVRKVGSISGALPVAFVRDDAFVPAAGRVLRAAETANDASIEVESFGRALLVMSVTGHRYWQITIDGRRVPARPVNIAFQGVEVPPGRHRVLMRYRNPLVAIGSVISALALAVMATLARKTGSN